MKITAGITLLSILFFLTASLSAQTLEGTVRNESGMLLPGVSVYIPALNKGTSTNTMGAFKLSNLPQGVFTIQFSFLGYKKETLQLNFFNNLEPIKITLKHSLLDLPGITVTHSPQPTDVLSTSQSVVSINREQLYKNRGNTIIDYLEKIPGLSTYTTGNGIVQLLED